MLISAAELLCNLISVTLIRNGASVAELAAGFFAFWDKFDHKKKASCVHLARLENVGDMSRGDYRQEQRCGSHLRSEVSPPHDETVDTNCTPSRSS